MGRSICLTCKGGRLLCGLTKCPLVEKALVQNPVKEKLSQHMFGPSPAVFVGWNGWPDVYAGPLTSVSRENTQLLDDPSGWYGMDFNDIIRMRSLLVRGKRRQNVRSKNQFVSETQEIALSVKPVDIETVYKKKPSYTLSFSAVTQPMGPSGELARLDVASNPSIPRKVDYAVSDELSASSVVSSLFDDEFDVYYLTRILSSGALGSVEGKRMVPTRWSITAVDDMLGKYLMGRIREYPQVSDFLVYSNTYLENHFEVLLIPGAWEFEQFEVWAPKTLWTLGNSEPVIVQENEAHGGRWDYALNEGGGYYAGRFAVCEALDAMRRQARAVVFREIYEGYVVPVGVWEVRENVRKAMENKPSKFATLSEALTDVSSRLRIPIRKYLKKSEILKQRRLSDFM